MPKQSTKYECPACGTQVTLYVTPTHPPTCSKHTGGGKVMKEKK